MRSEHRYISLDETPIYYFKQPSVGQKKAVLILVHGMGEYGGRYAQVSDFLSEQGMAVYAPDLRGHGKSGGQRGFVNRFGDFHEDLGALHRLAESQNPGSPIFIFREILSPGKTGAHRNSSGMF